MRKRFKYYIVYFMKKKNKLDKEHVVGVITKNKKF